MFYSITRKICSVELSDTEGSTLTHAKRTWLTLLTWIATSGLYDAIDHRKVLLNEVGVLERSQRFG